MMAKDIPFINSMAIHDEFFGLTVNWQSNVKSSGLLHLAMVRNDNQDILSSFVQLRIILASKHRSC